MVDQVMDSTAQDIANLEQIAELANKLGTIPLATAFVVDGRWDPEQKMIQFNLRVVNRGVLVPTEAVMRQLDGPIMQAFSNEEGFELNAEVMAYVDTLLALQKLQEDGAVAIAEEPDEEAAG